MKPEIYNYFPDTTPHAKFQGFMSTWVVWANSHFDAWKFLSIFSLSYSRPQVAFLDTSQRSIRHYASFPPSKCLLEVRNIKFEIWPPLPPKNLKNWTLSLRSMENCSRPNSGTVKSCHVQTWYTDWTPEWHRVTWLQGQKVKGQGHNVT